MLYLLQKIKSKNMQSINNQIKGTISKRRRGSIFFAEEFDGFGSSEAVRISLFRLCKENFIVRLSAGVYLYPRTHKILGNLYPSVEEIAKQIARREKSRIVPTGVYALNRLGLSTQVPMNVILLTDGAPRVIKIGTKSTVKFQKTTAKNLSFKGKIAQLVVSALKEIGKDKVTDEQLQKIHTALAFENKQVIECDAKLAPAWIKKILLNYLHNDSISKAY
jgi:hypothetical protein